MPLVEQAHRERLKVYGSHYGACVLWRHIEGSAVDRRMTFHLVLAGR